QYAGVRVFDIRDVYRPKEIAYYKPPALRTAFLPGSGIWTPDRDRTMDRLPGDPRFFQVPAHEEHGRGLAPLDVSNDNGFQVLRFTDDFMEREKSLKKSLFEDSVE